jgi:uncharacterized membrane protein YagU involved in acid resistance
MNWPSWMLWGFVATVVMTTFEAGSQELGLTRVDFPYLIGTIFTPDRDRAKVYGFVAHVLNGWVISLIYVFVFESLHRTAWWLGGIIGTVHALFVLMVVLWMMPGLHPRMASEQHGPTATRQLEPPGIFGLNYGIRTPIAVILSHILFGIILGAFYHLSSRGGV